MRRITLFVLLCCITVCRAAAQDSVSNLNDVDLGVTYSYPQALWLFEDETKAKVVLAETAKLGIKNFRLEAYWNWLQKDSSAQLDLNSLEWQLEVMEKYGAETVVLCLGRKVPRWPEYHIPEWTKQLPEAEFKDQLLIYLARLTSHFSQDSRITHFQVENEPLFSFGQGKKFYEKRFKNQKEFLVREIFAVKENDYLLRPIIVTDPGDYGHYDDAAASADILGLSYYRTIYRFQRYWHNAQLYSPVFRYLLGNFLQGPKFQERAIVDFIGKPVWLMEMQAEPWGPQDNKNLTPAEANKSMNPEILKKNLTAVKRAGFTVIFIWGIEWCAWMKEKGQPEMWQVIKEVIR